MRRQLALTRPPRTLITGRKNAETFGAPGDRAGQIAVLRRALDVLATASEPGTMAELPRTF